MQEAVKELVQTPVMVVEVVGTELAVTQSAEEETVARSSFVWVR